MLILELSFVQAQNLKLLYLWHSFWMNTLNRISIKEQLFKLSLHQIQSMNLLRDIRRCLWFGGFCCLKHSVLSNLLVTVHLLELTNQWWDCRSYWSVQAFCRTWDSRLLWFGSRQDLKHEATVSLDPQSVWLGSQKDWAPATFWGSLSAECGRFYCSWGQVWPGGLSWSGLSCRNSGSWSSPLSNLVQLMLWNHESLQF